jgi:hypothetical protein
MANKKYKGKAQQRPIPNAGPVNRRAWLLIVIVLIVLSASIIARRLAMKSDKPARSKQASVMTVINPSPEPASGDTAWDASWPSLPVSGQPARPIEVVRQAYAYAARRADVLQYMPCYCGCEKQGHSSNYACFMRGKTAAGVPQWDEMGYT